jgi:hypothetical protein
LSDGAFVDAKKRREGALRQPRLGPCGPNPVTDLHSYKVGYFLLIRSKQSA